MKNTALVFVPNTSFIVSMLQITIWLLTFTSCKTLQTNEETRLQTSSLKEATASYAVPINELSSLDFDSDGRLWAISDRYSEVVEVLTGKLATTRDFPQGSQFESLVFDSHGNRLILRESDSKGLVFRPLSQVTEEVDFNIKSNLQIGKDDLSELWAASENSRIEGAVGLANGHFMVLKEKDPTLLIEFGPKGSEPEGWNTQLLASKSVVFPERMNNLEALAVWPMHEESGRKIRDASDLSVGPCDAQRGQAVEYCLYLLSDESQLILRLEKTLHPQEKSVRHTREFFLPGKKWFKEYGLKAEDIKPEGLAVDRDGSFWVAFDLKDYSKKAVFHFIRSD